jgi:hypothetical protein
MRPIEIPVLGTIGIGVLVLAVSRVLLTSSVNGAVVVATIAGVVVFGGAMAISKRPEMPRRAVRGILFVGCVTVLLAGILSAVNGEREFHQIGGGSSDDDAQVETDH